MKGVYLLSLILLFLSSCQLKNPEIIQLSGETMGTSWHIKLVVSEGDQLSINKEHLKQRIESELITINQQFSTYIPTSEISLFNKQYSTQPFQVSAAIINVVKAAQEISRLSQGALDITVAPLIQLWGFGTSYTVTQPCENKVIDALKNTGYKHLTVMDQPPQLVKDIPQLGINLSAIAKGYAVDQLALILDQQGSHNYLIEIGGELTVKGKNFRGEAWHIAIEKPVPDQRVVQEIITLQNISVATSGDYHNYFEENGVRYSHTINPATGRPIVHKLASVTVLHPSAMMADGYATAIMVLGEKEGLKFAQEQNLQIYMIIRSKKGFDVVSTLNQNPH